MPVPRTSASTSTPTTSVGSIVSLIEIARRRGRRSSPPTTVTPALAKAVAQIKHDGQDLRLRLRPRPASSRSDQERRSTGSLGQQPFLQGFWPVMQLYLQIDRGIAAANLDTRAQLVTKDTVGTVGKRFEN